MSHVPDPRSELSVRAAIPAHGYLSSDPDVRDTLSLVFIYQARHPYSVLIDIATTARDGGLRPDATTWEVSREIIYDAVMLGKPSGLGDFRASAFAAGLVQLWFQATDPWGHDAGYHYSVRLSRPELRKWMCRTMAVVPMGRESECLDMDYQLQMLLS